MSEPLWAAIVGWIILIFGGGIAWGKHQTQLNALQKRSDNCDSVTVMTEDKCQKFHSLTQESMNIKLANNFIKAELWQGRIMLIQERIGVGFLLHGVRRMVVPQTCGELHTVTQT